VDLRCKRVYLPAEPGDGRRILVDRLWPRGVSRESLAGVPWLKEIAPSAELRKWFGHEPAKWAELKRRYFVELDANPAAVADLRKHLGRHRTTPLYAARDGQHNNAVALREYLLR
jgi:uncharacterized protein YeaO (DUF488 family)